MFRHYAHASYDSVENLVERSVGERVSAGLKGTRPPPVNRIHIDIGILIDYLTQGHEWSPLLHLELHQIVQTFISGRPRNAVMINRKMQRSWDVRSNMQIY